MAQKRRVWSIWGVRLGGSGVVLQAPSSRGLSLDPVPLGQDGLAAAEVDVGRREVAQALVGAGVIAALHEGPDLRLQITGRAVVLEQEAVLRRLTPALDLALSLRVPGRAADAGHALVLEPVRRVARDAA